MSILLPYQVKIVENTKRLNIMKKSRQIGGTFAFAFKGVYSAIFKKRNQLLVSASQRQSRIVMSYVEKFITAYAEIEEFHGLKLQVDQKIEKKFAAAHGGASIFCLPPNPETIRGFNGDIFLDEFALYKNDNKVYEAVYPAITRGYDINISSTCFGLKNMFYRIFTSEKYKAYNRDSINIYEAIAQGLKVDLELIKSGFDESSFRQEFECEFVDESTSYFSYNLLRELIDDYETLDIKGRTYIGIDVGRSHDKTSIVVLKEYNGVFYLIRREVLSNTKFDKQIEIIEQIFKEEQPYKVLIDKGLIGMQLAETLCSKYTFVEGVNFTNIFISNIVTNAKKLFEQKKFRMYDDTELISQVHSINKKVSISNLVSYSSERDSKGHSDSAWALLLGLYCNKKEVEYNVRII